MKNKLRKMKKIRIKIHKKLFKKECIEYKKDCNKNFKEQQIQQKQKLWAFFKKQHNVLIIQYNKIKKI